MKVVILAGGLGTRISELTKIIPKPMIKVLGKPIIHRIIDHYYFYGYKEFYVAVGYKGEVIQNYFKNCKLKKGIEINCINTGKNTMTGGRIKKLKKYLTSDFLLTYGDGLSNININKTISLGDSKNDIPMLNRTDFSCIIKLPNKNYINFNGESVFRSKKEAPLGWKEALMSIGEFADYVYE